MTIGTKKVTFHVDLVDEEGEEYKGSFTVRKPNFEDAGAISAGISRLTQGEAIVDTNMGFILNAVAMMSVLVEDYPEWWPSVAEEQNIPLTLGVFSAYMRERKESPFRAAKKRGAIANPTSGSSDTGGDGGNPEGDTPGSEG